MYRSPHTVFFLSDYGVRDEFAGVVRAVIRREAPDAVVIDLTHEVPPFDVVSGARTLARAVPHLGDGIVLAVVDPGVGSGRRALGLRVDAESGPRFFVGPDNGLLLLGANASGPLVEAVALSPSRARAMSATFDGRDIFAPAAAALCRGSELAELGAPVAASSLVRPELPAPRSGRLGDGRLVRWCEITWVDRFGNLQLNLLGADESRERLVLRLNADPASWAPPVERPLRRVDAFSDLDPHELGLLVDANDYLAVVMFQGSAGTVLGVQTGATVGLCDPTS